MLSKSQQQLQARRLTLLARCQQQRQELIWQSAQLKHELRFVELGLRAAQTLRASPVLIAAIAAALAIIKPSRVMWLLKTGLSSWRLWLKFAPMLMPIIPLLRRWKSGSQESP
ncbi:YqjK family protein [Undibacterium sp.]|uniref:YqjK family protein n=1 Tax=Undibacterium sp. TaxID=1914977 RepID=UPI003750D758